MYLFSNTKKNYRIPILYSHVNLFDFISLLYFIWIFRIKKKTSMLHCRSWADMSKRYRS